MKNMSGLARALCAATVLCSLAACASADPQPSMHRRSVQIAEHQTVTLAPAVSLRYDSVVDSRCPKNVQCVVAGKVTHSFTLASKSGDEVFTLDKEGAQFASAAVQGSRSRSRAIRCLRARAPHTPWCSTSSSNSNNAGVRSEIKTFKRECLNVRPDTSC